MIVEQKTILSTKMAKIIPIVTSKKQETEANTKFISVVGDDTYSQLARKKLEKLNISYDLITDQSRPTTFKIRYFRFRISYFS